MTDTWDESDQKYGRKVGFKRIEGYETTAYLDRELEPNLYYGTTKHGDEPVVVRWDEKKELYFEVPLLHDFSFPHNVMGGGEISKCPEECLAHEKWTGRYLEL